MNFNYNTLEGIGNILQNPFCFLIEQLKVFSESVHKKTTRVACQTITKCLAPVLLIATTPLYCIGALIKLCTSHVISDLRAPDREFVSDDLEKIMRLTYTIGLRHVSTENELSTELENGVRSGCSLNLHFGLFDNHGMDFSLGNFRERGYNQFVSALIKHRDHGFISRQELVRCINSIDNKEKAKILTDYQNGIDEFIENSFNHDICKSGSLLRINETTVDELIQKLVAGRFMIAKYHNLRFVSDSMSWGQGLGRHPKQYIHPENLVKLDSWTSDDLGLKDSDLNKVIHTKEQLNDLMQRCGALVRAKLRDAIRSLPTE